MGQQSSACGCTAILPGSVALRACRRAQPPAKIQGPKTKAKGGRQESARWDARKLLMVALHVGEGM
jgi:hypothetical protein